mgnify:FL=1
MIKRLISFAVAFFLPLVFFCGCNGAGGINAAVSVTIESGEEYETEQNFFKVKRGEDLRVELRILEGFSFQSCDYGDYSYTTEGDVTVLTLRNIRYPAFVHIETAGLAGSIRYDLNGGKFLDGSEEDYYIEDYTLEHHLRANTELGTDRIYREGYSQIGWNTRADGSGEHIGLGSRATPGDSTLVLYAEWAEWSEGEYFWEDTEGGISLTGYSGEKNRDSFVIPWEIDGKEVVGLSSGFADGISASMVVLPYTLERAAADSFRNCRFENLYFSDGVTEISDETFRDNTFSRVYINAVEKPRYQTGNEIAWFADMMDRLILSADEKKMIFFSGCSFSYGLDSRTVYEFFGGEYTVLNMGVIGGTNAAFQFDCISRFIGEGDVVVHAPEVAGFYQLMYVLRAEHRMFVMAEGNYDLISYADAESIGGLLTAFCTYNKGRMEMEEGSYEDYIDAYNEFGDIARVRPGGKDVSYTEGYTYCTEYVTDVSCGNLKEYYGKIESNGGRVLFSFSPVNLRGLSAEEKSARVWDGFESKIRAGISPDIPVISRAEDYLFTGEYFYDTNYHLNDRGVAVRTERLIGDIERYFRENGKEEQKGAEKSAPFCHTAVCSG